jgi:hypothetical protein
MTLATLRYSCADVGRVWVSTVNRLAVRVGDDKNVYLLQHLHIIATSLFKFCVNN